MIRGYFAFGIPHDGCTSFEIYSPHPGVRSRFPPRSLRSAVGLFVIKLIDEGYRIEPHAVSFSTCIDRSAQ